MSPAPISAIAGMRILMVEDEMVVAMSLADLLGMMDCEVVTAGRLDQARQLAETETIDGALLDINLGGDTVFSVADTLRQRDIPFIFMTGYDTSRLEGNYSNHPTLQKPFNDTEMERLMAKMFRTA